MAKTVISYEKIRANISDLMSDVQEEEALIELLYDYLQTTESPKIISVEVLLGRVVEGLVRISGALDTLAIFVRKGEKDAATNVEVV